MFKYWSMFETLIVVGSIFCIVASLLPLRTTPPWAKLAGAGLGAAGIVVALVASSMQSFVFPKIVFFAPVLFGVWVLGLVFKEKVSATADSIANRGRNQAHQAYQEQLYAAPGAAPAAQAAPGVPAQAAPGVPAQAQGAAALGAANQAAAADALAQHQAMLQNLAPQIDLQQYTAGGGDNEAVRKAMEDAARLNDPKQNPYHPDNLPKQ